MNSVQLNKSVKHARKFYLHRLLMEKMQYLARDEAQWQVADQGYTKIADNKELNDFLGDSLFLNLAIEGLFEYEQELKLLQTSLQHNDTETYVEHFRKLGSFLQKCAGNLFDQHDQPPYVDAIKRLYKGQNTLGEMFRRDAYDRVKQELEQQFIAVASLKEIFKAHPPKELWEYPAMKAQIEFGKALQSEKITPVEYKQAIEKMQREVFNA